jgi:HEAT repeat protein
MPLTTAPARGPAPRRRRWPLAPARPCTLALLLLAGAGPARALAADPPPSASAQPPRQALREEASRLLEAPSALQPQEADWAPLGPDALGLLEEIAANPKAPLELRSRAIAAMAVIAHPEASSRLQALVESSRTPPPLLAAAVLALGRRTGVLAVPTLAPLLAHPSEKVRQAAAHTLGRLGSPEARRLLEERLPLEEEPAVREVIQQGLTHAEP